MKNIKTLQTRFKTLIKNISLVDQKVKKISNYLTKQKISKEDEIDFFIHLQLLIKNLMSFEINKNTVEKIVLGIKDKKLSSNYTNYLLTDVAFESLMSENAYEYLEFVYEENAKELEKEEISNIERHTKELNELLIKENKNADLTNVNDLFEWNCLVPRLEKEFMLTANIIHKHYSNSISKEFLTSIENIIKNSKIDKYASKIIDVMISNNEKSSHSTTTFFDFLERIEEIVDLKSKEERLNPEMETTIFRAAIGYSIDIYNELKKLNKKDFKDLEFYEKVISLSKTTEEMIKYDSEDGNNELDSIFENCEKGYFDMLISNRLLWIIENFTLMACSYDLEIKELGEEFAENIKKILLPNISINDSKNAINNNTNKPSEKIEVHRNPIQLFDRIFNNKPITQEPHIVFKWIFKIVELFKFLKIDDDMLFKMFEDPGKTRINQCYFLVIVDYLAKLEINTAINIFMNNKVGQELIEFEKDDMYLRAIYGTDKNTKDKLFSADTIGQKDMEIVGITISILNRYFPNVYNAFEKSFSLYESKNKMDNTLVGLATFVKKEEMISIKTLFITTKSYFQEYDDIKPISSFIISKSYINMLNEIKEHLFDRSISKEHSLEVIKATSDSYVGSDRWYKEYKKLISTEKPNLLEIYALSTICDDQYEKEYGEIVFVDKTKN